MTVAEVMTALEKLGTEQTRKTWTNHGASGNFFGVKIGDMKVIQKKIKHNHDLALGLFDTGNADAMYFAGLISEPQKMTKKELQHWAELANWYMLSEYTVAWVAAESKYGHELALKWMDDPKENVATAGWSTYGCLLALKKDEELDIAEIRQLLERIRTTIHDQPNRVRYVMNGFVIAVGCYVAELTELSKAVAGSIGQVRVSLGNTACKVPDAAGYIDKVAGMGRIGKKKKTVFC